jgi:deferrochelatase/peroxidase EfeB
LLSYADTGLLDAGLFFMAYQKDPRRQFVAIQTKLGERAISTNTSGTPAAACSPYLSGPGDWFGKSLLG